MDQSWLTSTIGYVCKSVSGDGTDRSRNSDYHRVFSNGVWVKDLPTNNYEPLEAACMGRQTKPPFSPEVSVPLKSNSTFLC